MTAFRQADDCQQYQRQHIATERQQCQRQKQQYQPDATIAPLFHGLLPLTLFKIAAAAGQSAEGLLAQLTVELGILPSTVAAQRFHQAGGYAGQHRLALIVFDKAAFRQGDRRAALAAHRQNGERVLAFAGKAF